jgi:hypothetical protein
MSRQGKDPSRKSRNGSAARGPEGLPVNLPATTSMGSAAAPVKPDGSAAPADSAAPQKSNTYGTDLIN